MCFEGSKERKKYMRPDLFREQMTKVLIPKGELLRDFLSVMAQSDCELSPVAPGSLAFTLSRLSLPLLFVATRARNVQETINKSDANFGFTGTDIAAEQGLAIKSRLPSSMMSKKTDVVFASTPNWNEKVAKPAKNNFPKQSTVVTPYPTLTAQFLSENVLPATIIDVLGATEGYWWTDSQNTAVVDVRVSGDTMRANRVRPIETVLEDVTLALVQAKPEKRNTARAANFDQDAQVVEDLMVRINKQARRK